MLHKSADQFQPAPKTVATPPVSGALRSPETSCPVADMARRYAVALDQFYKLDFAFDNRIDEDQLDKKARLDCADTAESIMNSIEQAAPFANATSAEGALFQIILASNAAGLMLDNSRSSAASEKAYRQILAAAKKIDAMLWSVRRFLERESGIAGASIGGGYHMAENCSFLGKLEARAAQEPAPIVEFRQAAE